MADSHGGGDTAGRKVSTHGNASVAAGTIGDGAQFHFTSPHGSRRRLLEALPLLVTVGVATYSVLTWPGGPQHQYFSFYAFLGAGFACSVAYAVRGQGRVQLALALGCTLIAFGAHASVARTGEVPVEIDVRGPQPLHGSAAGTLTLVMPAPAPDDVRDRLRVALTVSDADPLAPTCVHRTTATLSATTPGVTPGSRRVAAESEVDLDLGGHQGEVVLSFTLQTDPNCVMRLAKVRGTLHND